MVILNKLVVVVVILPNFKLILSNKKMPEDIRGSP